MKMFRRNFCSISFFQLFVLLRQLFSTWSATRKVKMSPATKFTHFWASANPCSRFLSPNSQTSSSIDVTSLGHSLSRPLCVWHIWEWPFWLSSPGSEVTKWPLRALSINALLSYLQQVILNFPNCFKRYSDICKHSNYSCKVLKLTWAKFLFASKPKLFDGIRTHDFCMINRARYRLRYLKKETQFWYRNIWSDWIAGAIGKTWVSLIEVFRSENKILNGRIFAIIAATDEALETPVVQFRQAQTKRQSFLQEPQRSLPENRFWSVGNPGCFGHGSWQFGRKIQNSGL